MELCSEDRCLGDLSLLSLTMNIHFSPPDHPAQGSKRWLEFGVR